jgi:hypothetical protein
MGGDLCGCIFVVLCIAWRWQGSCFAPRSSEEISTIAKILFDQMMNWKGQASVAIGGHVAGLKPRIRNK